MLEENYLFEQKKQNSIFQNLFLSLDSQLHLSLKLSLLQFLKTLAKILKIEFKSIIYPN